MAVTAFLLVRIEMHR
ncbi:MAG: hypothetical protein IJ849_10675 [Selenomonadaceae bacterium]|nr:hypothetical protein [Selenomonadaceae bacterium]